MTVDSTINSLSWRGDARAGWLAVGNSNRVVGVTFTEELGEEREGGCHEELSRQNMRRNFNFREHSQNVTIVRWNKRLDKIATCDALGSVIVWKNQDGRSVMELVNHRGVPISDFQWSNEGNKVLISYTDGYVLVGTAMGRRLWARRLNIGTFVTHHPSPDRTSELLSSTWSADDSRVVVGSSIGELIELDAEDEHGRLISTTEVLPGIGIIGLQWVQVPDQDKPERLSLYLKNGKVVLMSSCGDQHATIIKTGLIDGRMQWSEDGAILAVAGYRRTRGQGTVRFFNPTGTLLFTLPLHTKKYVTALTWGHASRKLFVATGQQLHVACVEKEVPTLQALCRQALARALRDREATSDLPLPSRAKGCIRETFTSTIQGHVPEADQLLSYVTRQPPPGHRLFCTVKPNLPGGGGTSMGGRHRHATSYTLYVEQLGSLYPILVATRRSSKIRQSFTISVPSSQRAGVGRDCPSLSKDLVANGFVAVPETLSEHPADLPNAQTPPREPQVTVHARLTIDVEEEGTAKTMFRGMGIDYHTHGTLKEAGTTLCPAPPSILAEVVSNMMSSKFRVQGFFPQLPADLGTVSIKTSLLHIQPRKVTVLLPKPDGCDSGIESDLSSESASDDDDVFEDFSGSVSPLPEQTMRKLSSRRLSSAPDPAIILNSKTPTWNEQHMIYQLDFGGRVTTKSAKNFQLELNEKQVLQFGRIENGSFILDFQAPFSPIQAFSVALANLC